MKYSQEFKVGLAIVFAVAIFIIGTRYFQDLSLFTGSYLLYTTFDNAGGLVDGNAVRISGITVGRVEGVRLENNRARIDFNIDEGVIIPEGSVTRLSGLSVLGSVQMEIKLGPTTNDPIAAGGLVPSEEEPGLDALLGRAPALVDKTDSTLESLDGLLGDARTLLNSEQGDLSKTLRAFENSATSLDRLLRAEQERLTAVLVGAEELMGNLNDLTGGNKDSLQVAISNLNQLLTRLDRNLASLEATTASLDTIMQKIDQGEGTLGLLVNDPGLYHQLDSTLITLNAVLTDFQQNPKRYLKDLKLVDIF